MFRSATLNKIATFAFIVFAPGLAQAGASPGTCDIYEKSSFYGPRVSAAIVYASDAAGIDRGMSSALWGVSKEDVQKFMDNVSQADYFNSLGELAIEETSWEPKTSPLGKEIFTVSVDLRNETPSTIAQILTLSFNLVSPGRSVPWASSNEYLLDIPGGIEPGETVTVGPKFEHVGHDLPSASIPEDAEIVVTHVTACGLKDSFIWSGTPSH